MAVFLFWGQEEYFIEKEIKKLKKELLDDSFLSMSYKVFHNPSALELTDCVSAVPLMFGATLSVVHVESYLISNESGLDDKQLAYFENALKSLNDSVNIIFVCKIPRDENKKPDSRKKFYKILSKYAQVREFPQFKSYQKELNAQIMKMVKEKGLSITADNVSLIIEQTGVNLTLINSELEKLKTALHPKTEIDKTSIKRYCTSVDDVFSLADLIVAGKKDEALKQYNILAEKRYPQEIIAALQRNFRQYLYIKTFEKKMSAKDIAYKLKLSHEYIVIKTMEKLSGISIERLIEIRENLLRAEYKIKTGRCISPETELELALLS